MKNVFRLSKKLSIIAIFGMIISSLIPSVSYACPQVSENGTELQYSAADLWDSKSFKVTAGGGQDLEDCYFDGLRNIAGFVAISPDFELYYDGSKGFELSFTVVSACDSILLINTANENWYYDDDDAGNGDAKIRLSRPSEGWYDVWVGTFSPSTCDARLILETF